MGIVRLCLERNDWKQENKSFSRNNCSSLINRYCRQNVLVFLFLVVQYVLSFHNLSNGATALSTATTNNNNYKLSISEIHVKLDAWKNANKNTNTIKEYIVQEEDLINDNNDRNSRINHFAAKIFSDSLQTSNAANLACRSGKLMLNHTKVSGGRRVKVGDVITYLNDKSDRRTTVPDDPERAERFCASRMRVLQTLGDGGLSHSPLRVLYEDTCMAIVCKPAGIHTMSWSGTFGKSLCLDEILPLVLKPPVAAAAAADNALDGLDDDEPLPAPLPRHRLDRRVAGPVVVAKTRKACVEIGRSFEEKTVTKEYRAIVVGEINTNAIANNYNKTNSTISILSSSTSPPSFTIHSDVDGKPSETEVVVLGSTMCNVNGVLTDLKLFPKTGRRHQLRIHCAKVLGTPILGDDLYWEQEDVSVRRRQGLYLYCKKVSIGHPLNNDKVVSGEITEPLRFTRTREKALKGFKWTKAKAAADAEAEAAGRNIELE